MLSVAKSPTTLPTSGKGQAVPGPFKQDPCRSSSDSAAEMATGTVSFDPAAAVATAAVATGVLIATVQGSEREQLKVYKPLAATTLSYASRFFRTTVRWKLLC